MKRRNGWMVAVLGALLVFSGCGGGEDGPSPEPVPTETPAEDLNVITIGNLTDLTGASSRGMEVVDRALEDTVRYANEENMIPGVRLEVLKYDCHLDEAQYIPGYEWLLENGADIIWTGVPGVPEVLRDLVDRDGVPLFAATVHRDDLDPPGHLFSMGIVPEIDTYTLLSWVAENDWDYASKGPARIGGAGWMDAHSPRIFSTAEKYCVAHPDQFEWIGGYLTNYSFSWEEQVEALKDADYVMPPVVMTTFLKQYRDAGGTGTFLGGEAQTAFMELIEDADLWAEADGMLAIRGSRWWGEEGFLIDLVEEILHRYNPDTAHLIIARGGGYLAVVQAYMIVGIVQDAVEDVGAANVDSRALYESAQSYSLATDSVELHSYGPDKRNAINYYAMYEFDSSRKDIVRVREEWYPARYAP